MDFGLNLIKKMKWIRTLKLGKIKIKLNYIKKGSH